MHDRKVWELTKLPENAKPLGCRWVYTLKRNDKGEIARYKARLVAQGYNQVKGDSYDDTYSPVINFSIIRFFFALLVSFQGWSHMQCDVKGAYLYAPLSENIYITQPPGFIVTGKEHYVCKLNKALYGLHQSGRAWYFELHKVLTDIGFNKFEWCNCVYCFKDEAILLLYVDDILLFGISDAHLNKIVKLLCKKFDIKLLGKTKKLLGVEFEETNGTISLHQSSYIEEILDKFKDFYPSITSLPIAKGSIYSKTQCPQTQHESDEMLNLPYRNLLGCLSFLSNRTRPDIAYAVNIFSQFQSNPGMNHWTGLLRLLGYVGCTRNLKLNLNCNKVQLIAFSDADFATNRDDRTSMGGELVFLDCAPIMWRTFKHKNVSLSTMEAEFVSMTETVKELLWFDRILDECVSKNVLFNTKIKSLLYVDNMATIDFVKSPIENHRSKHIDVKLFFIRDLYYKDIFEVRYVKSKDNLADPFTKPLTKHDLDRFRLSINLKSS